MLRGAFAILLLLATAGCHRTVVRNLAVTPVGPEYDDRQWFTVGGLVPLSGEAGEECSGSSLAYAESYESAVDILIAAGLGVGGFLLGAAVCDLPQDPTAEEYQNFSTCVSLVGLLPPFLISSRTVDYRCGGAPMPPPPSGPPPSPPSAPPPVAPPPVVPTAPSPAPAASDSAPPPPTDFAPAPSATPAPPAPQPAPTAPAPPPSRGRFPDEPR